MRLRSFGVEQYGNFSARSIALDARPGWINLVTAPNGAGKSVLRQAISELLFGIHPQTPMLTDAGYARMRLRAEVEFPNGEVIGFVRRKGAGNTLTDPAGKPVHPGLPDRLPRTSERARLGRLFVLDSKQLRAGGKALLDTDGDLADALLSSAGDVGSARALAADLARRRDEAAPRRKTASTPFHKAGSEWAEAGNRLAAHLVRPPLVAQHERERAEAASARDAALARLRQARDRAALLARVRATQRHLRELDEAAGWLARHPDAPSLPEDAGARLDGAVQAVTEAGQEQASARDAQARMDAQLAAAAVDEAVLAQADAIQRLVEARSESDSSRNDIPKRQQEAAEARSAIASILRQVCSDADPAAAAGEERSAADVAFARDLILASADLAAKQAAAAGDVARADKTIGGARDELAALPAPAATEALRAAKGEALLDGEPGRQMQAAQAEAASAADRAAAALRSVPGWTAGPGALAALAVPAMPLLERLDQRRRDARADWAAALDEQRKRQADLSAARKQLADAAGSHPLPDAAALAAARAHRDCGWALVFARLSGQPDMAGEAGWCGGVALPLAFGTAMARADEVADRRIDDVERLTTVAMREDDVACATLSLAGATEAAGLAQDAAGRAAMEWQAAVTPAGLPGEATMAEARAFLAARDLALAAAEAHRAAARRECQMAERQAGSAARLSACLGDVNDSLARLVLAADDRLSRADQADAERKALERTLLGARRERAAAAPALEAAEAALAAWATEWEAVLLRLRLPPGSKPAVVAALLDRLVELPGHVRAFGVAQGRVELMTRHLARFAEDCAAVATRLGEAAGEPMAVAARLDARLRAARSDETIRTTLAGNAKDAAAKHRAVVDRLAAAAQSLTAVVEATGAASLEEARARVALSVERQAHAAARAAALCRLEEDGEGRDMAALRRESEANPPETIAAAKGEAEEEGDAAANALDAAAKRVEQAEGKLVQLAAGREAARAAADREAAGSELGRILEDAMVQHLAAAMLDHALEEVEAAGAANQRLARIGDTFAALTGGAYDRLSPAGDEPDSKEHGRLIAHEAGGGERHLGRLSEGTRDQLYLALRLVAVEDHVKGAPPLPFVADDVLQTFDDGRARAALEALVGLSRHVQVIVLTHHPHLAGLAAGLPVHAVSLAA